MQTESCSRALRETRRIYKHTTFHHSDFPLSGWIGSDSCENFQGRKDYEQSR